MQIKDVRFLIVEDEVMEAVLLKEILTGVGFWQFDHVMDLQDAKDSLASNEYSVILTDLSLPDCEGLDTFLEIQKRAGEACVIIISSTDDGKYITQAKKQGVFEYLVKGHFTGSQLIKVILNAIQAKELV